MYAVLLLLAPPMPPSDEPSWPADLDWLPGTYTADVQIERCREHIDRLDWLRRYRPGADGQFRAWIAETEAALRYWQLVKLASDTDWSDAFRRQRLYDLWLLIGPERYGRRYSPPLIPANVLPRPRKEAKGCPAG